MKICTFICIFFNYFTFINATPERIWLIRHCDKTKRENNNCCSKIGYERSKNWQVYFNELFDKNNIVKIYTSNFNEKRICLENLNTTPNSNCQKSQRMFLTAFLMKEQMKLSNLNTNINLDYCIGDIKNLLKSVTNNIVITDAIIVWEHKEIIDIIRSFEIPIKKWKNKYNNIYDIVFMINLKTKELFFDCFDYNINRSICSNKAETWLGDFHKIRYYYEREKLKNINMLYTNIKNPSIYLIVLFSIFLYSLLCFFIYFSIKTIITNRRRREYILIN
jgi:hypothetical protein